MVLGVPILEGVFGKGRITMFDVEVVADGADLFVVVDGDKIARRGYPGTPQAKTWISLEPGWEVLDGEGLKSILIKHNGVSVH